MTEGLFTQKNSCLAARLHGDPNLIHIGYNGVTIIPGLMQLQGFLALYGWQRGHVMEVALKKPVVVPSNAIYVKNDDQNYSLVDGSTPYSTATVREAAMPQRPSSWPAQYGYSLTDGNLLEDWRTYTRVPTCLVRQIIPETDPPISPETLDRIATVGVAANALTRALVGNKGLIPGLFIPGLGEGDYTVLEGGLHLYMGEPYNGGRINEFELGVHRPDGIDNKNFTVRVSETTGLYTLEFDFVKVRLRVLERLLRNL